MKTLAHGKPYSALDQLDFHEKHGCARFSDSLNYFYFTLADPANPSLANMFAVYTGQSMHGYGRALAQTGYLKYCYDNKRDKLGVKLYAQVYEQTVLRNGLCLMAIREASITDQVTGTVHPEVEISEFASMFSLILFF